MRLKNKNKNKKINFKKADVLGTVIYKPRKSYILEEISLNKYKLGEKELKKIFPGDLVSCSISNKGWATINKVIQTNTKEVLTELRSSNKKWVATPISFGHQFNISIEGKTPDKIKNGSLSKVIITRQPNERNIALGRIDNLIDTSNIVKKATDISIIKNEIQEEWPVALIQELDEIRNKPNQGTESKRIDLRKKAFVTIDGKSAKDFDDAVFAETNKLGNINLYIAIADVSHFIGSESELDKEAKKRGTSIYFPEKVIPMLPEHISNDLCSLRPNKDRLVLVSCIEIDPKGHLVDAIFFEGIINSKARLIYEEIEDELKKENDNNIYYESLKTLKESYQILKRSKLDRGALELDIPQYMPIIKNNEVSKFISSKRQTSHLIIEECMLLANICAASLLSKASIPSIYRVHPKPDKDRIKKLESFVRSKGLNVKLSPEVKVKELSQLASSVKDKKNAPMFHLQILQTLALAKYETEVSEHFALSYSAYTHFTSPIRRYPDLMVHRAIKALIHNSKTEKVSLNNIVPTRLDRPSYPYDLEDINKIAIESSRLERKAESASRDVIKTLKCECALNNTNKEFSGIVQTVTNFGLFILIKQLNIEGLCHIKFLPRNEFYAYDEVSQSLTSSKSGHKYSLGDELKVKVKKVDIFAQLIDIEIL